MRSPITEAYRGLLTASVTVCGEQYQERIRMTFQEAFQALVDGKTLVLRGRTWHDYFRYDGTTITCENYMGGRSMNNPPSYTDLNAWWDLEVKNFLDDATLSVFGEE